MPKLFVLPTQEDQMLFRNGRAPENCLEREFGTPEELAAYRDGLESLYDLSGYEVTKDEGLSMEIDFDGESREVAFASAAEKAAYVAGLEDADGFVGPEIVEEGDEGYERLQGSADAPSPVRHG